MCAYPHSRRICAGSEHCVRALTCPPTRYMYANLGTMLAIDHTRTLINPDLLLARTGQGRERLEDSQRLRVVKRMRCAHIHPLPLHTFT